MTKIVIADDHRVVRSGLRMLLDREEDFEVVADAGDVANARRYVRAHRPDVLILDLNMPGDPSLPAIPIFRDESPDTRVVVLTMQEDPAFAREALQAGASGYVSRRPPTKSSCRPSVPPVGRDLPRPVARCPHRRGARPSWTGHRTT
jgi:DNA-binding NarL/FixJ family response regulator